MTISNSRPTLDDLARIDMETAESWPVEFFEALADDVAALEAAAKTHKAHLLTAVAAKYAAELQGHALGTKRINAGDVDVVFNTPKNVAWDNATLARVETQEGPDGRHLWHYLDVKRTIPEKTYDSLPVEVSRIFEAARTVKAGAMTVKFERKAVA